MISREEYYVSKPKIDAACKRLHHAYVAVFGKRGVSSDERVAELNAAIDYFEGLTSLRPGDVLPTWFELCSEQDSEPETETKMSPTELQKVRWSSLVERLDRQDAMLNEILRRIGS